MSDVLHSPRQQVALAGLLEAAKHALLSEFERELAKAGYGWNAQGKLLHPRARA